jgi:putative N6-adenine-specific DNA methylase
MEKHPKSTSVNTFKITAKTIFGLEEILAEEIRQRGGTNVEVIYRGVQFSATKEVMYACNYHCRTALRFLKPEWEFPAADDTELYNQCMKLPWDDIMGLDNTFSIDGAVFNSGITHSMYAALKTKDAIADYFREKFGRRPSVDTENPDVRINLHINRDHCTISLDSSGSSLHLRGYKVAAGTAPLSEVLASGLIMLSGWDKETTFVDPMCGSGTFLTEAAMIAGNIPAGYYRSGFGFEKWNDFDPALWKTVTEKGEEEIIEPDVKIIGGDMSSLAMRATRKNISSAGLEKFISLTPIEFEKLKRPPGKVHMLINPPYGERVKSEDIIGLYQMIGDTLKQNYKDSEAWIIGGDLQAMKFIGLRPSRKIKVFNGPIECRLMKFELYEGSKKAKKSED